jgi:uncharacterized protein (DUF58 family)
MSFADAFPGFRLRLTKWGGGFLVATLVLGFAAVNTGNNALMALLGFALASYVVSGTWSRQVLGRTDVEATLPREVYAGRPAAMDVVLRNRSRLFPAYGIVLRDRTGRRLLVEPLVPPGATRRRTVEVEFGRRGWNEVGPWTVDVLMPLGFFLKSKSVLDRRRLLVYPKILRSSSAVPQRSAGGKRTERFTSRGREGDVVQLRGYREGDDVRQMHWKQTARQRRPIVVDRQRRAAAPAVFVVDSELADPLDAEQRRGFEVHVSEVATAVARRLEQGEEVGLVVGRTVVPPVRSIRRMASLMRPLAEVQPTRRDPRNAALRGSTIGRAP